MSRFRWLSALFIVCGLSCSAPSERGAAYAAPLLYVGEYSNSTVSVVDVATDTIAGSPRRAAAVRDRDQS